jgi:hypothetical protein
VSTVTLRSAVPENGNTDVGESSSHNNTSPADEGKNILPCFKRTLYWSGKKYRKKREQR